MRAALLLLLALTGCSSPAAVTVPLPFGFSTVVTFRNLEICEWQHEYEHQRQVRRYGAKAFLMAIAAEHAVDGPRCGPLELAAYKAEMECTERKPLSDDFIADVMGCK